MDYVDDDRTNPNGLSENGDIKIQKTIIIIMMMVVMVDLIWFDQIKNGKQMWKKSINRPDEGRSDHTKKKTQWWRWLLFKKKNKKQIELNVQNTSAILF